MKLPQINKVAHCVYELSWICALDARIVLDTRNCTILEGNPAALALLGYSHSGLAGLSFAEIIAHADRERAAMEVAQATPLPTTYCGFHILRQDGTCIPVNISTSGRLDFGDDSVLICQFQDVSELLERERLLEDEREHSAHAERQLACALSSMVAPILRAMEMRDPYTVGHQARVAEIAVVIGRDLDLPEDRLEGLRMAALVHDIGKISIPSEILTKPGKRSVAERAIIYDHPEIGYALLKDIPFPWPVADIVRQHHERLDGSGYPLGLTDHEILPESKILAVADMVEAMVSHRPYRPAIPIEVAVRQIESEAGILLDADAVRSCAALIRSHRMTFPLDDAALTPYDVYLPHHTLPVNSSPG